MSETKLVEISIPQATTRLTKANQVLFDVNHEFKRGSVVVRGNTADLLANQASSLFKVLQRENLLEEQIVATHLADIGPATGPRSRINNKKKPKTLGSDGQPVHERYSAQHGSEIPLDGYGPFGSFKTRQG